MKLLQHTILIGLMCLKMALSNAQYTSTAVSVIDGGTYQMLRVGRAFTVRLANVEKPESTQAFGGEATKNANALLLGKTVVLDSLKLDRYNRVLASVTINNKTLDSILVSNGWICNGCNN